MAMALTRLKEYEKALQWVDILLSDEPNNMQMRALRDAIEARQRKGTLVHFYTLLFDTHADALVGGAIMGGVAVVAGGIGLALLAALTRSSRH